LKSRKAREAFVFGFFIKDAHPLHENAPKTVIFAQETKIQKSAAAE